MKKKQLIEILQKMISEKIYESENPKTPAETSVELEKEIIALQEAVRIIVRGDI